MRLEFRPQEVIIEPQALGYPLAQEWKERFVQMGIPVRKASTAVLSRRLSPLPPPERFRRCKRILAVVVRRRLQFETCRPSADYQLPLVSGCPGHCQYCYLNTNFGLYPYVRVYANQEEILAQAKRLIREAGRTVYFEAASTSDPVAVEPLTHNLRRAITFFAQQEHGRLRFVTKFTTVESFLDIDHRGHTAVRVSVNIPRVVEEFETGVPPVEARLEAARRLAVVGYPVGYMLGPVFLATGWEEEYVRLIREIWLHHPSEAAPPTFEIITHRFTPRAKNLIATVYPRCRLDMTEEHRIFKYGQFGYGKYLYPPEEIRRVKEILAGAITSFFPEGHFLYIV